MGSRPICTAGSERGGDGFVTARREEGVWFQLEQPPDPDSYDQLRRADLHPGRILGGGRSAYPVVSESFFPLERREDSIEEPNTVSSYRLIRYICELIH